MVDELPELLEPLELRELLPELDELPDDLFDDPELEDPEFDGETLLSLLVLVPESLLAGAEGVAVLGGGLYVLSGREPAPRCGVATAGCLLESLPLTASVCG